MTFFPSAFQYDIHNYIEETTCCKLIHEYIHHVLVIGPRTATFTPMSREQVSCYMTVWSYQHLYLAHRIL